MTQPIDDDLSPGSPRWYLNRLTMRLLGRQARYDRLENYAQGRHPYPNGDKRYVSALHDLQRKSRTNYCELVIKAVTERMKVTGFQFGPDQQVDDDAKRIWNYNDMDYQSPLILNMAATFGDTYVTVSPPIEPDGEPVITAEDPRMCITEPDPRSPTRSLAGLKMWHEPDTAFIFAVLYLPDAIYKYSAPSNSDVMGHDLATLTHILLNRSNPGGYKLESVSPNPLGDIPLVRGNWQPAFGTMGRGEAESIFDIQDRINHTILDRLVIAKSQAYNQRWVAGAGKNGEKDFRPGADMVWATVNPDSKFGQFDAADLTQVLEAIRDDVGDLAAVSQTPATYLMNRMVNVSGDTLTQDQSALVRKVMLRSEAMGWMYERAMRLAFKLKGDTSKSKETEVVTLWADPEIHTMAEIADSFSKFVAGGVPIDVAMKKTGLFTDDQIEYSKEQFDKQQEMAMQQEQQLVEKQGDNSLKTAKQQGDNAVRAAKAKPKPTSGGSK